MFFEQICWSPTCANWAIAEMNHKSFLMRLPSSRKDCLFKWNEYICYKIVAVHFGIIWEFVDNAEAARVPHNRKHEFLLWISSLSFVTILSLDRVHIRYGDIFKTNNDSSPVTRWCQSSRLATSKMGSIACVYSIRFSRKSCVNRCGT
jgi:hypothetical protein